MISRKVTALVALAVSAALGASIVGASAAEMYPAGYYYKKKRVYSNRRAYRHSFRYDRSYRVGGQASGQQYTPYLYNGPYTSGPYFQNQTFWERVQTQSDYPVR